MGSRVIASKACGERHAEVGAVLEGDVGVASDTPATALLRRLCARVPIDTRKESSKVLAGLKEIMPVFMGNGRH